MKICQFVAGYLPSGGYEYAVHYLSNVLVKLGHEVTVLARSVPDKVSILDKEKINYYICLSSVVSGTERRHLKNIKRTLSRNGVRFTIEAIPDCVVKRSIPCRYLCYLLKCHAKRYLKPLGNLLLT